MDDETRVRILAEFDRIGEELPQLEARPNGHVLVRDPQSGRHWTGPVPELLKALDRTPAGAADFWVDR